MMKHVYQRMKGMRYTYNMITLDEYGYMNHQGKIHISDNCLQLFFVSAYVNIPKL